MMKKSCIPTFIVRCLVDVCRTFILLGFSPQVNIVVKTKGATSVFKKNIIVTQKNMDSLLEVVCAASPNRQSQTNRWLWGPRGWCGWGSGGRSRPWRRGCSTQRTAAETANSSSPPPSRLLGQNSMLENIQKKLYDNIQVQKDMENL